MSSGAHVIARPATGRVGRKATLAGAGLLSFAMLGSGLLVYVFLVLTARVLGADEYGGVAVLWAGTFISVIVVFRPLEQTISRSMASRRARGQESVSVVRATGIVALCTVAAIALLGLIGWSFIRDRLFAGDAVLTAALLASIAAYGFSYLVRGLVAGAGWYRGYAIFLLADGIALLSIASLMLFVPSRSIAACAIVCAGLAGAIVPLLVGRRRLGTALQGSAGPRFHLGSALTFAGPAGVIAISDQVLVNGGPILVMLEGGTMKTAGLVFAATILVRVCVYVYQGFAASLLPNLTRLHAEDEDSLTTAAGEVIAVLLAVSAVIIAGAALIGPELMTVVFGNGFDVGRLALVLMAIGIAGYLGASVCSHALLAADLGRRAAVGWSAAAVVFLGVYFGAPGGELTRIGAGFCLGACTALVLLAANLIVSFRRSRRAAADAVTV